MGHLGDLKQEYRDLLKRLDAGTVSMPEPEDEGAREAWRKLLELYYTPEEAHIASRMPVRPSKLEVIAGRLGHDPETMRAKLEPMCDKGLVMDFHTRSGKVRYMLSPPVIGFFEFSMMRAKDMYPKKELARALITYMHDDPAFAEQVFGGDTVVGRALVHEDQLEDGLSTEILDWERATSIIENATMIAVTNCYCRHKAEHLGHACDHPQETCLSFDIPADYFVRRGFSREITKDEALAIVTKARKAGLVQIGDNIRDHPTYICNCCSCCCGQLQAIQKYGLRAVNPSGYLPTLDDAVCKGCSRCARACPVGAISMAPVTEVKAGKNDMRPLIDPEVCIGCGVCATICRQDGLDMIEREERTYVPLNSVEKSVRMAIERGRLADLLFDEGQSRRFAFLNRAVDVLTRLPVAERALASEQVRSRFVRQALGMVRDPAKPKGV